MKVLLSLISLLAIAASASAQEKGTLQAGAAGKGQQAMVRPGGGHFGPGLIGLAMMPGKPGEPMTLHPALMKLPEAKQEQLRKLHGDALKAVQDLLADLRAKRQPIGESMRKYPADAAEITKQQDALEKVQRQLFTLHLNTLVAAQKVVDKATWDAILQGPPMGRAPAGPMGGTPGMRGRPTPPMPGQPGAGQPTPAPRPPTK